MVTSRFNQRKTCTTTTTKICCGTNIRRGNTSVRTVNNRWTYLGLHCSRVRFTVISSSRNDSVSLKFSIKNQQTHAHNVSRSVFVRAGGSNNKKDHARGKSQDVLCFFVLFQSTLKIDVFVPNLLFSQKCVPKKQKRSWFLHFLIFFVLLTFLLRWLTKFPQTENKKEQKKIMPLGKSHDLLSLFLFLDPPPSSTATE